MMPRPIRYISIN